MISYCHAWLDFTHDFAEGRWGCVYIGCHIGGSSHVVPTVKIIHLFRRIDTLMNHYIGTFGILNEPLVGHRVPSEHKAQPFPIKSIADRAIQFVNCGKRDNPHPVLFIYYLARLFVIELVCD